MSDSAYYRSNALEWPLTPEQLAGINGELDAIYRALNATQLQVGTFTGILPPANGGTGTGTIFTQGSVVFAGASGIYAQDNANFFWDATNHRLGLGITAPITRLHSSADGVVPNAALITATTQFALTSNNACGFQLIAPAGNTQFGATSCRGTLTSPTALALGDVILDIVAVGYDGSARFTAADIRVEVDGAVSSTVMPGRMRFFTTSLGGVQTEVIRISGGNVGIGAFSPPFAKLEVLGASQTPSDLSSHFSLSTGTGAYVGSNKLLFGVHDSDYSWIQAVKAGTSYLNLALNPSAGFVGIGTTGPLVPFHVSTVDSGVGDQTLIAIFERTGAAPVGTAREIGLAFRDANNGTLVGGVTGIRENSAATYLGGVGIYVHNTSATPGAVFSDLLRAVTISSQGTTTITIPRTSGTSVDGLFISDTVTGVQTPGFGTSIVFSSDSNSAVSKIFGEAGASGTNNESQLSFYTQNVAGALKQQIMITSVGYLIAVGYARGTAVAGSQVNIGRNSSGSGAPGCVGLVDRSTIAQWSIFPDTSGVIRVNSSAPAENGGACDLVGTIIGFQTEANGAALVYDAATNNANVNPGTGNVVRLTSSSGVAAAILTGFSGGVAGRVLIINNQGPNGVVFRTEDASSTAANRFSAPGAAATYTLGTACAVMIYYDGTLARWVRVDL